MTTHTEDLSKVSALIEGEEPEKAIAILETLVAKGDTQAMIRAADCYAKGLGVPRNLDESILLLKEAADSGSDVVHQLLELVEKVKSIEADSDVWQGYGA